MVRSRGHAENMDPLGQRAGGRRRSWLRTAQLNLVGWSALIGVCLLSAAAGLAVAAAARVPLALGAAFGVAPLLVVALLDRRRWSRMQTSFSWGGSVEDVAQIAAELQARGAQARVVTEDTAIGWGESMHPLGGERVVKTAALEYANRDRAVVRETLRRHGVRLPDVF